MLLSKNTCCRLRCSPFLAWALGSLSMASMATLWLSEGTLWFTNVDLWVSSTARPHVLSFTKSSVLRKRSLMPTRNCQRRVAADQCRVDRVGERWEPSRQVIDGSDKQYKCGSASNKLGNSCAKANAWSKTLRTPYLGPMRYFYNNHQWEFWRNLELGGTTQL